MLKRTLTQSDIFLIVANLLPVAGVWFLGWRAEEAFIVYCFETIIIGIFNLIKMGIVTIYRKTDIWYNKGSKQPMSGLFFMFFFLIHYGFFVAIQMGLFFGVSGIGDEYKIDFFNFFYKWPQLLTNDALIGLAVFALGYAYKTLTEFILPGEYKTIPLMLLMFQPYLRIFVQQVTVILGSIFLSFGAGKVFILIFVLIKIYFDILVPQRSILRKTMMDMKKDAEI